MFAREVVQVLQVRVDLGEAIGIEIACLGVVGQRAAGLADLDQRGIQQFAAGAKLHVDFGQACQFGAGACQAGAQAFVAFDLIDQCGAASQQALGVAQTALLGFQRGKTLRGQRPALEFRALVRKQIQTRIALAAIAQRRGFARQRAQVLGQLAHLRQRGRVTAVGIEQGQLLLALQQRLMLVLAVDLQQMRGQFAQLRQRHRAAVDPRARTARGGQHAAQAAMLAIVHGLLAQPGARGGGGSEIEFGADFGALRAAAYQRGVGTRAGEQQQGIDQQRLAGAGFAGDHGQTGAQRDLGLGDHGQVAYIQRRQHEVVQRMAGMMA